MSIIKKIGITLATLGMVCTFSTGVSKVHADTYYGNGVYCNKHTCHIDWGDAIGSIANNIVAGVGQGMGWPR